VNWSLPLQALLAYLLGSIPSAYIAGRWLRGLDIRQHGSGNVGATNVFRVLGKGPGAAVLLADAAKGALAVLVLPLLALPGQGAGAGAASGPGAWWPCALGLAAVLGHSYTVFLGFKGGKGVATSMGVFLGLAPLSTLAVIVVFAAVFLVTRMVSVGSLAGAALLPLAVAVLGEWRPYCLGTSAPAPADPAWDPLQRPVLSLAVLLAVLVWVRHIPNIRRIAAGTESRFARKKQEAE